MFTFPKPDVEQLLRTVSIIDFAVSPDEKQIIISTNISGKYNLWAMNMPNAFPYRLTFNDQPSEYLLYDPKGRFVIAGFDHDGDENTQFYAMPTYGGALKELVFQENTRNFHPFLSKDGERLYYTSTKENASFLSSYCLQMDTGEETKVFDGNGGITILAEVSEDESVILYTKQFSNTNSLYYVKKADEHILLTPPTDTEHTVSEAVFVSDQEVYLITDYDADFSYLASFNLETREFTKLKELPQESFTNLTYDQKNKIVYITAEKGVRDYLYAYRIDNQAWVKLNPPCDLLTKKVVSNSGSLYLLGKSSNTLANIFKQIGEDEWVTITDNTLAGVQKEDIVEPEIITYSSFDGLQIEALLYKAKPENDNGETLLWVHGGPQSAVRKGFNPFFQYALDNGYSVFTPNFRGSTGYGLPFTKMVERAWGAGARLDIIAGLDWLIDRGYTKKGDILLIGGSYGGYMSLLLHGRHADYFKAVVDIFGPSNLFSFVHSVPEDWKPIMDAWVGHPEKDREKLIDYSPITYIEQMIKPMLVIQGANDPRVVKAESDQIVETLKEQGRDISYMVMEDEGHGFSKKENEIVVYRRVLAFFEEHRLVEVKS
ncbi:prolyl oligopeptidase family serine peptidase [Bacillus sp. E214]|uniref:S9 family peptidase n=1 Tax=Bacillus sp. E214 TaxID=2587156 RepID=UPI0011DF68BA|nr:prolyl oligopeptidase family serine peptidase [Bacillus sp. E214]